MTRTKSESARKSAAPKRETKIANVISLLGRKEGATLEVLTKAVGWQSHTVRAALTGLKKKGHKIERTSVDGTSRYSLTKAPAQ